MRAERSSPHAVPRRRRSRGVPRAGSDRAVRGAGSLPHAVRQQASPPERPSGRILFVASTGGHLTELNRLAERFDASPSSVWVTFDCRQSRTLLAGRTAVYVPYVTPRDVGGALRAALAIRRVLRSGRFDAVVSTGAAVALSAFVAARLAGVRAFYIESVARVRGPSLTGRIVAALRLAALRTQHEHWGRRRWLHEPSVLTDFGRAAPRRARTADEPLRVVVALGTIQPYRFDALVDAVLASGLANESTVWQLGATVRSDLPGLAREQFDHDELLAFEADADLVITHAGVGTILELLELGVRPVVVPRSAAREEHVDDHQYEIARHLAALGVVTVLECEDVTAARLRAAAGSGTAAA